MLSLLLVKLLCSVQYKTSLYTMTYDTWAWWQAIIYSSQIMIVSVAFAAF